MQCDAPSLQNINVKRLETVAHVFVASEDNGIDLHIAGYRIRLTEAQDSPCFSWPLHPFDSFLDRSNHHPDIDLAITIIEKLPDLSHGTTPLRCLPRSLASV